MWSKLPKCRHRHQREQLFFYFLSRRVTWDDKNESSFCRFRFKSQDDDGGQASRLLSFQDYPERKKEIMFKGARAFEWEGGGGMKPLIEIEA